MIKEYIINSKNISYSSECDLHDKTCKESVQNKEHMYNY